MFPSIAIKHKYPLVIIAIVLFSFSVIQIFEPAIDCGIYVNRTPSEPYGLYRRVPIQSIRDVHIGDLVIVSVPEEMKQYIYGRHWAKDNTPLIKSVGGMAGDQYTVSDYSFYINERYIGIVSTQDVEGLPLPHIPSGVHTIQEGNFLAISSYNENSFDSRYMGEIPQQNIIAKVVPWITW